MAMAATLYYLGRFESAQDYAAKGVAIWRSGEGKSQFEEIDAPVIAMLCHKALCEWHFGEAISSRATIAEAISVAREFQDGHGLAVALFHATVLAYRGHNLEEVERLASELVELSTKQNFAHFVAVGTVLLGWARSAAGNTAQGISWIQDGMELLRASGSLLGMLSMFALKAEALHLAGRTSEALQAINEAEALVEASGGSWWCAELYRLRAIILIGLGAEEARIEEAFSKALKIAKQQKSVALAARVEATSAKYPTGKEGPRRRSLQEPKRLGGRPSVAAGDSSAGAWSVEVVATVSRRLRRPRRRRRRRRDNQRGRRSLGKSLSAAADVERQKRSDLVSHVRAPPHEEPEPAVQPKQWLATAIGMFSSRA